MGRAQSMITVFAALGLLTFASSLAAQPSAPTGTKLQRSDRNFIVKAAKDGEEEVELGRLAQAKASSDAVKQFGQRMVEDHGSANKELMDLAANKAVAIDDKAPKKDPVLDSGAVDPNLKAWIDKTLPTFEDHLETIERIQAQMASAKK